MKLSPDTKIGRIASAVKVKRGYWLTLADGERIFCWNRDVSFVCDSRYRVTFAKRPGERDCVFILEEENE